MHKAEVPLSIRARVRLVNFWFIGFLPLLYATRVGAWQQVYAVEFTLDLFAKRKAGRWFIVEHFEPAARGCLTG